MEVVSVPESERLGLNYPGITATQQTGGRTTPTPREEPYLEPTQLDKPSLQIYDAGGSLQYALLEEPESGTAWIRTHKNTLVDVEAQR